MNLPELFKVLKTLTAEQLGDHSQGEEIRRDICCNP